MSVQVIGSGTIGGIDEGLVVSGIVTATELDISGNIDVDGHTNLDNVSVAGVSTFTGNADFSAGIDVTGNAGVSGNISVGGVISIPDTIQHVNDTNTKIRFPAVDTVSVETAGSERLRIQNNGFVGIGTDNAVNPLEVWGSSVDLLLMDTQAYSQNVSGSAIAFQGYDSAGSRKTLADVRGVANGENRGEFAIRTRNTSGQLTERLRIVSDGDVGIGTNSPVERFHVHKSSATGPFMYITNTSTGVSASDGIQIGYDGTNTAVFKNNEPTDSVFYAGSQSFRITSSGHVLPDANNTQDLGSSSKRWRNVYTTDLQLSNKGKTNDVDNTWGDYTIQEGESDLFLINNRNGKKYKFNLTEVS